MLLPFALHIARVDTTVKTVVAVTRCRDYKEFDGTMEEHVKQQVVGTETESEPEKTLSYMGRQLALPCATQLCRRSLCRDSRMSVSRL